MKARYQTRWWAASWRLGAGEEFGGGRGGENGSGQGHTGVFGVEDGVEFGFEVAEAALLPIGVEHGLDVKPLVGGLRLEPV